MSRPPRVKTLALYGSLTGLVAAALVFMTFGRGPGIPPGATLPQPPAVPYLAFVSVAPDDTFHRLLLAPSDRPAGASYDSGLRCERAAVAAGAGVCIAVEGERHFTYVAAIFDAAFRVRHRLPLAGVPGRVRVSPDGRLAAVSVYEHTHDDHEMDFVARTLLVDTASGAVAADVADFAVADDSGPVRGRHVGYWGLTFAPDGRRFFATLDRDGAQSIVEGDLIARRARVLVSGESPSLSPDGARLVYKERLANDRVRLRLRDLATGADAPVAGEGRSVDDQVEWLDDRRIVYHLAGARGADLWALRVDGAAAPRLLRGYGYSPSVAR